MRRWTWRRTSRSIDGSDELMVIGGAQIYAAALPRAQRLYLTRVHARPEGDAFLPAIDWSEWREERREEWREEGVNGDAQADCTFLYYTRDGIGSRAPGPGVTFKAESCYLNTHRRVSDSKQPFVV
jgi:hypothetical protein